MRDGGKNSEPVDAKGLALAWIDKAGRFASWTPAFAGNFPDTDLAAVWFPDLSEVLPTQTPSSLIETAA